MSIKTFGANDSVELSQHFNCKEFKCKCGKDHDFQIDTELIEKLEQLFDTLGCSSIVISSGFRCKEHDISVGGSGTGQHTLGKAADFCCFDADKKPIVTYKVCCAAQDIGFRGIARINDAWTHCDVRSSGKWYGDETKGNNSVTDDFYKYFNMPKEETMKKGIDISYCQTQVTWSEVTAEFVIVKAGQRDFTDPMFESHYKGAKAAGIPVGAYWYLDALTVENAQKEADAFIQRLSGKQFEYPVFLDLENESQFQLGKKRVSELIRAFLERVEKAGYWVGLYMSKSQLENYVDDDIKSRYCIWLAQWDVSKPTYGGAYGIWQYKVGKAAGIKGDCDLDYCYVDYPAQIKAKGLNGYGKQPDKPPEQSGDDTAGIAVEMAVNGKRYGGTLKPI